MNLASILNLVSPASGGTAAPAAAPGPDAGLAAEFAALLGTAALPVPVEGLSGEAADEAASGGNILPDLAGTKLPDAEAEEDLPRNPSAPMPLPPLFLIVTLPKPAPHQVEPTTSGLTAQPAPIAPGSSLPPAPVQAAAPARPEGQPQPSVAPQPVHTGLSVRFDLHLQAQPAAMPQRTPQAEAIAPTAQQLAAMPLVQRPDQRREAATGTPSPAIIAPATPKEAEPQVAVATSAPPNVATALATPTPAVLQADPVRASPSETPASPAPVAARHDFEAVVERLSEARELARPGRATMQLAHREFGPVSVQFDMAGQSLKVGLTSADASFAPAVQAALAERPVLASGEAQAGRNDQRPDQRNDQSQAAFASSTSAPATQSDGQSRDQHGRAAHARHPSDQVRSQPQDAASHEDNPTASRARDGSLFA